MAEGFLRAALGTGARVGSAGLRAQEGYAPHLEAIRLMAERGINITPHRSRQVTADLALGADLILVMERVQKEACESLAPSVRGRVFLLGQWLAADAQEVPDPLGGTPETFAQACDQIDRAIQAWLPHLTLLRRNA